MLIDIQMNNRRENIKYFKCNASVCYFICAALSIVVRYCAKPKKLFLKPENSQTRIKFIYKTFSEL